MKDNEKNLSDGLNDDELESVAGGALRDWNSSQQSQFIKYMKGQGKSQSDAMNLMNKYSPKDVLKIAQGEGKVPAALAKILK